jgi:hypothetical protein
MPRMTKILGETPSTRLAVASVLSALIAVACGKDETANKAPAAKTPDAKAPETKSPETKTPETPEAKAPETTPPTAAVEPKSPLAAKVYQQLASAAKQTSNDAQRATLEKCMAALAQATGTGVDDALKQLGTTITAKTFTGAEAHKQLAAAFGGELTITPDDIDTCVQLRGQALVASEDAGGDTKADPNPASDSGGCQQCQCDGPVINCCGGEDCACSCEDEGGICSPYCECFPGSAMVRTASGAMTRMRDLAIGDRVEVVREDGTIGFDEIYLFTHKQIEVEASFVELWLASGQRVSATARHFIPVGAPHTSWSNHELLAAEDVQPGHRMWIRNAAGMLESTEVIAVNRCRDDGLFNPLTISGTIVVDGVVASAHSDWFLDGFVSAHVQGKVYQTMFAPVRGLYRVLGPTLAAKIAEDLGIVEAIRDRTMAWQQSAKALLERRPAPQRLARRT